MIISVVTVCQNSEATIARTIDSFFRQSYPHKELIVIDGASSDRTLDIVRRYGGRIELVSEPDQGTYDAMNKGLRRFRGAAVGFLNSDDSFHDNGTLERIAEGLREADIVYGDQHLLTAGEPKRLVRVWEAGNFHSGLFKLGWVPPHPTFYIRRQVAEKVGEFDTRYRLASDYDFMLRALELERFRVHYIPEILIDYQIGGASSKGVGASVKGNLECLDSRRRHLHSGLIDRALFLRYTRRLLQLRAGSVLPTK